ncbi:hypothetical protein EsH8_VII_000360 [Colletotrichum jinshuiense]
MKLSSAGSLFWLSPWLVTAVHGCSNDNCARAVTGTRRGAAFVTTAKADCQNFMVATQYGHTSTVTTTTATTSASAVPTGPGYSPVIPASYDNCLFDPASGGEFELLTPNVLSIINKDGKAVEATDPAAPVDPFTFHQPADAPKDVYDIELTSGGKTLYFAVFKSGAVGFVDASSNGQSYVGTGDQYVTTIWSVECDGLATAGILGGDSFQFVVKDNGDIVATSSRAARKSRRDIPVPKGFYIQPRDVATPPGTKCASPVQHATTKTPPVPLTSNGCGPEGFWGYFVPNGNFVDACNAHDVCWSDCSQTFAGCNTDFLNNMITICNTINPPGIQRNMCLRRARFYHSAVSGSMGAGVFTDTIEQYCDCVCDDPDLTACQDKCVDTKTDPENCGSCNFNCPSESCTNGACSFNSCTGQTCGTFSGSCGAGGSCRQRQAKSLDHEI